MGRRLGDAGVLVNIQTNDIFELNDTAMRVWELLDTAEDLEAIVSQVVLEYEVDRDTAERETRLALERFGTQGVVTR